MGMLAIVAAIIFAIAWIINATGTATNAWFSVTDLLLIGLACLALHQAGHRQRLGQAAKSGPPSLSVSLSARTASRTTSAETIASLRRSALACALSWA